MKATAKSAVARAPRAGGRGILREQAREGLGAGDHQAADDEAVGEGGGEHEGEGAVQPVPAAGAGGVAEHRLGARHRPEERQRRHQGQAQGDALRGDRGVAVGRGRLHEQRHRDGREQAGAGGGQRERQGLGEGPAPDPTAGPPERHPVRPRARAKCRP